MIVPRTVLFVLPAFSAAIAVVPSCSAGTIQCCKSVEDSKKLTGPTKKILGPLGINIDSLSGLVGITCAPIVGDTCSGKPLCCQHTNFNGAVVTDCNSITL
ncbi:hypothetical protein AX15_003641 [Amanita polypyramis BW_CC]|nr:hypothetical protein AX15_003641 [Amanita polypyramis BW_CC]